MNEQYGILKKSNTDEIDNAVDGGNKAAVTALLEQRKEECDRLREELKKLRQELVSENDEEQKKAEEKVKAERQRFEELVKERTSQLRAVNDSLQTEIAERKAQEQKITKLTRLYAVLSQVNETIVRTHEKNVLFDEVCRIIAEEGEFPLVWIGQAEGRGVIPLAGAGPAKEYLRNIRVEVEGELGKGPTGTCIRENHFVVNDDFAVNPATLPWKEAADRFGFRASAAFPLRRGGNAVFTLTIYALQPSSFDVEQVALLESLSADLSYALDALDQEKLKILAEQALRESEERYHALFNSMTEGFALHEIICDEQDRPCDYRFLDINPAFERQTGLKREDVIGRTHNELLPGDSPRWIEIYGKVALTGEPIQFDNYSPTLKKYFEVFAYRPAPRQFAVLFMDVTGRKQAEEKIVQLRREQEAFMRHEVKNMFAPMQLFSELLLQETGNLTGEQIHYLHRISESAERVAAFIDAMKKIQIIEAGTYSLKRVRYPLDAVIQQAIYDVEPLAEKNGVTILLHARRKNALMPLDMQLMPGVFSNLILNAVEHIARLPISSEKMVNIDFEQEQTRYIVRINNKGELIPPERLATFFEKFNPGPEKRNGTGLGTTYAYLVTKAHGGEIMVDSERENGTTVTLVFPVE